MRANLHIRRAIYSLSKAAALILASACVVTAKAEDLMVIKNRNLSSARAQFTAPNQVLGGEADLSSIRGLKPDELVGVLGKPDSKTSAGNREEWRYGNSLIFIQNGSVNAWSDGGDLVSRKVISNLRTDEKKSSTTEFSGWKNAWEKEESIAADDVISELVKLNK